MKECFVCTLYGVILQMLYVSITLPLGVFAFSEQIGVHLDVGTMQRLIQLEYLHSRTNSTTWQPVSSSSKAARISYWIKNKQETERFNVKGNVKGEVPP